MQRTENIYTTSATTEKSFPVAEFSAVLFISPHHVRFLKCNQHQSATWLLAQLLVLLTSGILEDGLYQHSRNSTIWLWYFIGAEKLQPVRVSTGSTSQVMPTCWPVHRLSYCLTVSSCFTLLHQIRLHIDVSLVPLSVITGITPISSHNLDTVYSRFTAYMWLFLFRPQAQGKWLHFDRRICLYWEGFLTWTNASWCLINVTIANLGQTFVVLKICLSRSGLWCQLMQFFKFSPERKRSGLHISLPVSPKISSWIAGTQIVVSSSCVWRVLVLMWKDVIQLNKNLQSLTFFWTRCNTATLSKIIMYCIVHIALKKDICCH